MPNPHAQLKKEVAKLKNEFIAFKKEHSQKALVTAMKDVASAIREGGGGGGVAELRQQMADAMDKITALTNENTAALKGGTDGSEETKA